MKKSLFTSLTWLSASMLFGQQHERPNVIFFLADDLGWTDLGCYGSEFYETPNIDQLAKEGILFKNAYAACPVSSPTRVSIQTGKYPARIGVTDYIRGCYHEPKNRTEIQKTCPVLPPDNLFNMPLEETTIGEVLKSNGYQTAHIGKWHVAEDSTFFPQYQGYDINIAGCDKGAPGPGGYFVPYNNPFLKDGPEGEYLTDRLGDECVEILNKFKGKPFFINFPFYQVHTPLIGKADKVSYFEIKAHKLGLDTISEIFDYNPVWKYQQPFKKRNYHERIVQNLPVYAAMLSSMDDNIGKVIAELKRLGLYENTIIIFTSDNGGLSTSAGSPTSNLPLKAGKGHLYEGGIRVPLFAVWKGHFPENKVNQSMITSTDYFPTILDLLKIGLPSKLKIDGESMKSALYGKYHDRGAIYWHYPHYGNLGGRPGCAIRKGDYKLIEFFDNNEIEIYNIKHDISESHNLMNEEPKLAEKLLRQLNKWKIEVGAKLPTKNLEIKSEIK